MHDPDKTGKINFIPRCQRREATSVLAHSLEQALLAASVVGHDIHDAISKLLASVRRREIEQQKNQEAA